MRIRFIGSRTHHYTSTTEPILREAKRRGHDAKWGSYKDKVDAFVYTGSVTSEARKNARRKFDVCHPHGLGLEPIGPIAVEDLSYMFTRGIVEHYKYTTQWPQHAPKFRLIGFPKSDRLFNDEGLKMANEIEKAFNVKHPLVTFTGEGPQHFKRLEDWKATNESVVKTLSEMAGIDFIFRPHTGHVQTDKPFFDSLRKKYRFKFMTTRKYKDITPLLRATDVLVGGTISSVINEFMPLDRPTVVLNKRRLQPVGLIATMDNLRSQVERCLSNPGEFSAERRLWAKRVIYKANGQSSKRAVDELERIMETL